MGKISVDSAVFNSRADLDTLKNKALESGQDLFDFAQKLTDAANHTTDMPYAQFTLQQNDFEDDTPSKGLLDFTLAYTLIAEKEAEEAEETEVEIEAEENANLPDMSTEYAAGKKQAADMSILEFPQKRIATAIHDISINGSDASSFAMAMLDENSPEVSDQQIQEDHTEVEQSETPEETIDEVTIGIAESKILDFSFNVGKDAHHVMVAACMLRSEVDLQEENGTIRYERSEDNAQVYDIDLMPTIANFLFAWVHDNIPEKDQKAFRDNCQAFGIVDKNSEMGFTAQIT